jgi:hypothetical protein
VTKRLTDSSWDGVPEEPPIDQGEKGWNGIIDRPEFLADDETKVVKEKNPFIPGEDSLWTFQSFPVSVLPYPSLKENDVCPSCLNSA